MKRKIGAVLFVIYSIIAIIVTVLLLSYNDYNCSEIGGYTVYIVTDDSLEPTYKQGTILLIKHSTDRNIQVGDDVFIYNVLNSQQFELVSRTLEAKTQQGRHIMYTVSDGENTSNEYENYSSEYCIGKVSNTIVIEHWGTLLAILESKWGYLFCIVIVSLLLFLQEVFDLIMEIKYGGNKVAKVAQTVQATPATQGTQPSQVTNGVKKSQSVNNENNQVNVK